MYFVVVKQFWTSEVIFDTELLQSFSNLLNCSRSWFSSWYLVYELKK